MNHRALLRPLPYLLCLLVLFLPKTCKPVLPAASTLPGGCPSASLPFLSESNWKERSVTGQRYGQDKGMRHYENIVRRYAAGIGMDWRLLSAIIWHESQFNAAALSNMEAKGLMQIRDVTVAHFGLLPEETDLFDPETNLSIGTRLLGQLVDQFRDEGMDSTNAVRFALASYNCGSGALAKWRNEAYEAGFDADDWPSVALIFDRYAPLVSAYIDSVEMTYFHYRELTEPSAETPSFDPHGAVGTDAGDEAGGQGNDGHDQNGGHQVQQQNLPDL